MTTTTAVPTIIEVTMPVPFSAGWNLLDGVIVDDCTLRIDPAAYFYRFENPTWLLCDWDGVRRDLLAVSETPDQALEQRVLDYIRAQGPPDQRTRRGTGDCLARLHVPVP
jgi:hypothetical protein